MSRPTVAFEVSEHGHFRVVLDGAPLPNPAQARLFYGASGTGLIVELYYSPGVLDPLSLARLKGIRWMTVRVESPYADEDSPPTLTEEDPE